VSSTAASIGKGSADASDDDDGLDDGATPLRTDDIVLRHDAPATDTEWTCDKCTLINAGMFDACFACDAPRTVHPK